MSEYSKLIEDLLVNGLGYGFQVADLTQRAAKALKAQAKEIEQKSARIAELEAALKPFADIADIYEDAVEGDKICVPIGDFRAARAALNGEK
jgi:hypothetical protein